MIGARGGERSREASTGVFGGKGGFDTQRSGLVSQGEVWRARHGKERRGTAGIDADGRAMTCAEGSLM
jgi:hypothetical protein